MNTSVTPEQRDALEERTRALASLEGAPGWEALKLYLTLQTQHVRIDFADPQWAGRKAYQDGRVDLALDLLKIVEASVKRVHKLNAGA